MECNGDFDCPNEKACIGFQCINPCSLRGACGANALCRAIVHKPRCSCPQCYVGMPHTACHHDPKCDAQPGPAASSVACESDADCPSSLACSRTTGECYSPCRKDAPMCTGNKRCEVHQHRPVCVCKAGFVLNSDGELTCAPGSDAECTRDQQCASNLACVDGQCRNPCTLARRAPCPPQKTCEVLNHHAVCICTRDCNPSLSICLRDSGCPSHQACRNYRCEDPCESASCADAPCFVEDHKPICKFCPPGFVTDSKYGCLKGKHITVYFHYRFPSSQISKNETNMYPTKAVQNGLYLISTYCVLHYSEIASAVER